MATGGEIRLVVGMAYYHKTKQLEIKKANFYWKTSYTNAKGTSLKIPRLSMHVCYETSGVKT